MNSQREEELKPCPMCGGKADVGYEEAYSLDSSYEYVGCTVCTARVLGDAEEWNTRQAATEQGVGEAVAWDDPIIDPIVSKLYRKFKEWNRRGFTADDVTWCEVRGYVSELLNTQPPKPTECDCCNYPGHDLPKWREILRDAKPTGGGVPE